MAGDEGSVSAFPARHKSENRSWIGFLEGVPSLVILEAPVGTDAHEHLGGDGISEVEGGFIIEDITVVDDVAM